MKIRFYCYIPIGRDGTVMNICRNVILINAEPVPVEWSHREFTSEMSRENSLTRPYSTYLLSALSSDFLAHHPEHCDLVLQKIAQIEAGEIEEYMWEGQGFLHYIKLDSVLFEHNIFGECPEWPLWSCSLAQYKAALQGWRQFIDMPKSIDSQLIIELPDDDSSHFPQL